MQEHKDIMCSQIEPTINQESGDETSPQPTLDRSVENGERWERDKHGQWITQDKDKLVKMQASYYTKGAQFRSREQLLE